MRVVAHAAMRPHHCAVIPFKGNSNSRGFIDTGIDLQGWDPHVYISLEAAEEMARSVIGWQPPHVLTEYKRRVTDLEAKVAETRAELEELRAELDAVQVLKNSRFVQQGAPGRPRKQAA